MTISTINLLKNNLADIDAQLRDYRELISLSDKQLQTGDISMIDYLTLLRNFTDLQRTKIEKEIALLLETNNYNYWY